MPKEMVVVKVNKNAVNYSLCGKYLAYGVQNQLIISDLQTGEVMDELSCLDVINYIEWSIDSDHILCATYDRSTVQVFSIKEPDWYCRILEGATGLQSATWSPTGYHILTIAEYMVKITIWSLIGRSVASIENPLFQKNKPLSFSPNGSYLAVFLGTVENYKITLYSTSSWQIKHEIKCTQNLSIPSQLLWSPCDSYIAMWETLDMKSCLLEIYSVNSDKIVGTFKKNNKTGIFTIRCVLWSPNAQFLFIGCSDNCIYAVNYITWTVFAEFQHIQVLGNEKLNIFQQIELEPLDDVQFELRIERPVTLTSKKNVQLSGISNIAFSHSGEYMASKSDLMPAVIWIWNAISFNLETVIIFLEIVTDFKWNPVCHELLVCNNKNFITTFKPDKTFSFKEIDISLKTHIQNAIWRPISPPKGLHLCAFSTTMMYILNNAPRDSY